MSETFEGFVPPTKNFFHMPNEWINISARINNLAELKVVQYVLRHTWGYREYDGKPKPITVDEFMHGRKRADGTRIDDGTGLSKPSVIQGLKYAIKNGYLVCEIDDTDKARVIKSYALKMSNTSGVKDLYLEEEIRGKDPLPQESNIFTPEVKDLYRKGKESLQRSEKDTKERHLGKKESTPSPEIDPTKDDSSLPSLTPSLSSVISSQQDTIPTSVVDNSSSSVDKQQDHIATDSIPGNVESVTTGNDLSSPQIPPMDDLPSKQNKRHTEPLSINKLFNNLPPEQRRIAGYLKQLKFPFPYTEDNLKLLDIIAEFITSLEETDSYLKFTQSQFDGPIFLGNLANMNNMSRWVQMQNPPKPKPKENNHKRVRTNEEVAHLPL